MSDDTTMDIREKEELDETREGTREGRYFRPDVDIWEDDEALFIAADVPGCTSEDIDVNLEKNRLTISAHSRPMEGDWEPVYGEFRDGHFLREFRLGKAIDQEGIQAQLSDGVLALTLPKSSKTGPRRIEIQTE